MWDLVAKVDFIIIDYTPPSDTITELEGFILLLSFLIKDFYTAETRLNYHTTYIVWGVSLACQGTQYKKQKKRSKQS